MDGWSRHDTIEGNGYFWQNQAEGMSAFEDTSEEPSLWYAWMGTPDDHETADHSTVERSLVQAVVNLP